MQGEGNFSFTAMTIDDNGIELSWISISNYESSVCIRLPLKNFAADLEPLQTAGLTRLRLPGAC